MAGTLGKIVGTMIAGSGQTVAGLVQGQAGTNITQASLTSITYAVYRLDNAGVRTLTGSGSLTVSAVVFDTPQTTDPRYGLAGGFNFLATIPATCFAVKDRDHEIRVTFTPASGQPFVQPWGGNVI